MADMLRAERVFWLVVLLLVGLFAVAGITDWVTAAPPPAAVWGASPGLG